MADDSGGHRTPPKPVSLLTLALQQHNQQQQQPQAPVRRPRSHNFYGEAEHFQLTGENIHEMREEWAKEDLRKSTVQPFLHSITHGGASAVDEGGLVPKNKRNAMIQENSQWSTNNNTDVFVAGPEVTKRFFGLGPLKKRDNFVHVIGESHDFMPDADYQEYVRKKEIKQNDSVMFEGNIPPLRDAKYGDKGPKSFMMPMSPRTKRGASRYLTGQPNQGELAAAEIQRRFVARFGEEEDF